MNEKIKDGVIKIKSNLLLELESSLYQMVLKENNVKYTLEEYYKIDLTNFDQDFKFSKNIRVYNNELYGRAKNCTVMACNFCAILFDKFERIGGRCPARQCSKVVFIDSNCS